MQSGDGGAPRGAQCGRRGSSATAAVAELVTLAEDIGELGARVVSVFGPFGSSTLVQMPTSLAAGLFGGEADLGGCAPRNVIDAVERDLAKMPAVADTALAAVAVALARELEHPYNSATSKSMCAARLNETMAELRALAPPERKADSIDRIAAQREKRQAAAAGGAASADLPRP